MLFIYGIPQQPGIEEMIGATSMHQPMAIQCWISLKSVFVDTIPANTVLPTKYFKVKKCHLWVGCAESHEQITSTKLNRRDVHATKISWQ